MEEKGKKALGYDAWENVEKQVRRLHHLNQYRENVEDFRNYESSNKNVGTNYYDQSKAADNYWEAKSNQMDRVDQAYKAYYKTPLGMIDEAKYNIGKAKDTIRDFADTVVSTLRRK